MRIRNVNVRFAAIVARAMKIANAVAKPKKKPKRNKLGVVINDKYY
jgi:hypothetical protein